jgi:formylmethanofuran dehydrogenase subunit A
MVKITNISDRTHWRRLPSGTVLQWDAGQTRDVESKRLLEEVSGQACFKITDAVGTKKVGGGVKTHVKGSKPRGRPSKPKAKKEEVKGLKKAKKEKAD